jgi:CDP-diacylglycerol---glycerol-3-phosphate 3-phosphatidyltransferase
LSEDYFTNRLDRYHIFSSKELTDYYARIHDAVCDISYRVIPAPERREGYVLESPMNRGIPDPVWHPRRFKIYAKHTLEPLIHKSAKQKMFPISFSKDKTFIYPVAQFDILLGAARNQGFLQYEFSTYTSTEKPALTKLLASLSADQRLRGSTWVFTAGYFNIDPDIANGLIEAAPEAPSPSPNSERFSRTCTVITASPWANGFYGSHGISGMLPAAYTLLSRRFLRKVAMVGKERSIELKEWRRGTVGEPGGWTYHAKGLWVTLPRQRDAANELIEEPGPSVTLVGSSNYTKRSYSLDLEIGAMIVTGDESLKKKLREETEWLQKDAQVTTQDDLMKVDRRVSFKVRVALWLVEKLGGAL